MLVVGEEYGGTPTIREGKFSRFAIFWIFIPRLAVEELKIGRSKESRLF